MFILLYRSKFVERLFNRVTLTKVFLIFSIGYLSRLFIHSYYDVNVFVDFSTTISLVYYSIFSFVVVVVGEVVSYFQLDLFLLLGSFIKSF